MKKIDGVILCSEVKPQKAQWSSQTAQTKNTLMKMSSYRSTWLTNLPVKEEGSVQVRLEIRGPYSAAKTQGTRSTPTVDIQANLARTTLIHTRQF